MFSSVRNFGFKALKL